MYVVEEGIQPIFAYGLDRLKKWWRGQHYCKAKYCGDYLFPGEYYIWNLFKCTCGARWRVKEATRVTYI